MHGLLKTPLYDTHLKNNARMVEFAGYSMPVQYPTGIKAEHLHTREQASLFDVSHMGQALFGGPTAAADLEALLPVDLDALAEGHSVYTVMCNPEGGIIDDLILTCLDAQTFMVVFNAACKQKDIDHFLANVSETTFFKVEDEEALLALQGPEAAAVLEALAPGVGNLKFMTGAMLEIEGNACLVTRSGYTGEDGYEISMSADYAPILAERLLGNPVVRWAGLGARDSLRLEAGLCLYGHDMDESHTPVEANLMWTIAKSRRQGGEREGGFVGAEAIFARQKTGAAERHVGLRVGGRAPVREGSVLVDDNGDAVGVVTSGGFAPTLGAPIAMGYVRSDLTAEGTLLSAMVRGRALPLNVCATPFVPRRYYRG